MHDCFFNPTKRQQILPVFTCLDAKVLLEKVKTVGELDMQNIVGIDETMASFDIATFHKTFLSEVLWNDRQSMFK